MKIINKILDKIKQRDILVKEVIDMRDSEPAFPCEYKDFNSAGDLVPREQYSGMTLRDYFASKAMQAIISANTDSFSKDEYGRTVGEIVSERAYVFADMMLKARQS